MSTILSAIQTELGLMTTPIRPEYADLDEANATIFDQIGTSDFPVCLIIPFDVLDGNRENGSVKSTAEINMLFLNRYTSEQTIDKKSLEIENLFVAPMRTLAREFVNRLDDNDIIHEEGISSVTHRSVHQPMMDAHLYGCWSVFTVKFEEGISICPPH